MSYPISETGGVMIHQSRVVLEPELEAQVQGMDSINRRLLAKVYFRWAKQLYVSSHVLEQYELREKVLRLELPPR